jgi:hypothetical protein
MAQLGRIESMLAQVQEQNLELLAWTRLQDERIKPITDLLGELAEAEQAPDQPELDGQGDPDVAADYAAETGPPFPIRQEGEMGDEPAPGAGEPSWQAPGPPGHSGPNTVAPQVTGQGDPDYVPGGVVDQAISTADQPQATGSLWRNIAAPEPDPERMAQLGDPRLVEDEG